MKRFIIILAILLCAGQAWGATYYVNPATGANGNSGTASETPWMDVQYANLVATAGDTVNIVAPSTNPARWGFYPQNAGASGNVVTYQGTSASQKAYIVNTIDVSHGTTIGNYLFNGNLEGWSGTTLWRWGIDPSTGTCAKETTTKVDTASIKMINSGGNVNIYQQYVYLPGATAVTLSFAHYETANDYRFKFTILDTVANQYLQLDKTTWGAASQNVDSGGPCNSNGSWATCSSIAFTTQSSGAYTIIARMLYNSTSYIDNLSITANATTYAWAAVGGHNYYKLTPKIPLTVTTLAKGTSAAWTASGLEGLSRSAKAADLATCDTTPGTWWWDGTDFDLYYTPAAGETVATMHFEAGVTRLDDRSGGLSTVEINKQYVTLNNIKTMYSPSSGVYSRQPNTILSSVHATHSQLNNFYFTASATGNDLYGAYTYTEDNYDITGAGVTVTLNRAKGEYAHDDGFQAYGAAKMVCNYCVALNGGIEGADDNTGFATEEASSAMDLYNCAVYGFYSSGIYHGGTGNSIVKNCIAYGNVTGSGAGRKNVEQAGSNLTATNNAYTDENGWDTDATDVVLTSSPFVDAAGGNFTLGGGSPAINSGVVVSGVHPGTDYAGQPNWKGAAPDIGAYEKSLGGLMSTFTRFNTFSPHRRLH